MTNTAEMTNTELQAALFEACTWSDWYFDEQNWYLAEQWGLRAEELQAALERRRRQ